MNATKTSKPASLGAGLVRKGDAAPAPAASVSVDANASAAVAAQAPAPAAAVGVEEKHVKLSLKLDEHRYTRLRLLGVERRASSQALLVEAVDLLLEKLGR